MIIDEHRHIGNCEGRGTPTMESILADMDLLGVDSALVAPSGAKDEDRLISYEEAVAMEEDLMAAVVSYFSTGKTSPRFEAMRRVSIDHSLVCDAVERSGGRLLGVWWLNPWGGQEEFDEARNAITQQGFRYFKMHPQHHVFSTEEPAMARVMEFAESLDVPVWFHSNYGPGSECWRFADLARLFPRTNVILGHALCGGGSYLDSVVAACQNENVYVDLSHGYTTADCLSVLVKRVPHDRLLMASDAPFGNLSKSIEICQSVLGDDDRSIALLMGENAARLLKINP